MTREEFLDIYEYLLVWKAINLNTPVPNWEINMRVANPKVFAVTPNELCALFSDKLQAMKYYKNIHGLSLPETVKIFKDIKL